MCVLHLILDYSDSNEIHNIDDSDDEIEALPAQQQYQKQQQQQPQRPHQLKVFQMSSSSSSSYSAKPTKMYVTEYPAEDHLRLKADLDRIRQRKDRHYLRNELIKQGATKFHRHLAVKRSIKWYVLFYGLKKKTKKNFRCLICDLHFCHL